MTGRTSPSSPTSPTSPRLDSPSCQRYPERWRALPFHFNSPMTEFGPISLVKNSRWAELGMIMLALQSSRK